MGLLFELLVVLAVLAGANCEDAAVTITTSGVTALSSSARPWDALRRAERLLASPERHSLPAPQQRQLHVAAAEAFAAGRLFSRAADERRAVHDLDLAAPGDAVAARAARRALAVSLRDAGRLDEALAAVREALLQEQQQPAAAAAAAAAVEARALRRIEASVLDCAGRSAEALASFNLSRPLADAKHARDYIVLVSHLRACDEGEGGGSRSGGAACLAAPALAAAAAERAHAERALLRLGPWLRAQQLPAAFEPRLRALPLWHARDQPPRLASLVALLAARVPALRAEFEEIARRWPQLLLRESECIAVSDGGEDAPPPWRYLTVNAPWIEHVDRDACSVHTPVACALVREAAAAGFAGASLRGTYSALAGGGVRLRPHFGRTNAQLKLHAGLIVPKTRGGSGPCAFLTVANETRAWEEGAVLAFDDSFEHSVSSSCESERVVFQLVLPHVDLSL